MFVLNELQVRNLTSKAVFEAGTNYYLEGNVKEFSTNFFKNKKINSEMFNIKGMVISENGDKIYRCSVSITEYGGIESANCDCQSFINYFPAVGICKHVVALLLKYITEKNETIQTKGSREIQYLIKELGIGDVSNLTIPNKEINLSYTYEHYNNFDDLPSLQLKVGEGYLYVVKNIEEFIRAIIYKDINIYFGKNFTFNPNVHKMKKQDEIVIDILVELWEIDKEIQKSHRNHYSKKLMKDKKVYLPHRQAKKIFSNLKGRTIEFKHNFTNTNEVKITEEKLPLEFSLYEKEEDIILKNRGLSPILLFPDGRYVYFDKKIYCLDEDQYRVLKAIQSIYKGKIGDELIFHKEDKEALVSFIIPSLKKLSSSVSIDSKISEKFYQKPLEAKFYLDKEENGISLEISFIYGDRAINPINILEEKSPKPLELEEKNKILIRDILTETRLINTILQYNFQKENHKFILKGQEPVVRFIQEDLQKISQLGEVYYSQDFKNIKINTRPNIVSSVRINDESLLELQFDIEGLERNELKDIFKAIKEKNKYYKLKDGGFLYLDSKELGDFFNFIEYLNVNDSDLSNNNLRMPIYSTLYIYEAAKEKGINIKKDEKFSKMVSNIKSIKRAEFTPNIRLNKIMREYQKFGFKWLKTLATCGFGGILGDEMGLGKTLQAIAFIESEINGENNIPSLVVAPTSLVYNWKEEIERFAPNIKFLIISGDKKERSKKIKLINNYHLIITSYPLIRRDIEDYGDSPFKYCLLDEAQHIKNPNSINAKAVKKIKAKAYFALTGTPIENSLVELWSIFDFIMPGYLMNYKSFSQKYELPIVKDNDENVLAELNKHIKPFILRRLKSQVMKELPPKIEHKILVEMSNQQKKLYSAYLNEFREQLAKELQEKGFKRSKLKILAMLTRLRQICDDPSTFIENYKGSSGKMELIEDLLEESIKNEHRVLLFSQFTSVLKNIEKILVNNKIDYMYLDGKTDMEERVERVKSFNEGNGKVFLISLKAGGTGLNLTGADMVIHFDPWWNPAVEEQATDRAHRIGQEKTVEVIKLITRGTIEEKIYDLQQKKKQLIESVMNSDVKDNILISQMNEEEIQQLFIEEW